MSEQDLRWFIANFNNPILSVYIKAVKQRNKKKDLLKLIDKIKYMENKVKKQIVRGRDFLEMGYQEGEVIGKLVKKAYKIQLDYGIYDKYKIIDVLFNNLL